MNHSRAALIALLTSTLVLAGCSGEVKVREPRPSPTAGGGTTEPGSGGTADPGTGGTDPGNGGTGSGAGFTGPDPSLDPTAGTDPALQAFYSQDVDWVACPDLSAALCADITVPMDYTNPDGETITIAVNRNLTAGDGKPTIFLNPGGPGGSGTDMLEWAP